MPDPDRTPKQELHDAIQAAVHSVAGIEGAAVTRWCLVVETAVPGNQLALVTISADAGGRDLRSWEVNGMLATSLTRSLKRSG